MKLITSLLCVGLLAFSAFAKDESNKPLSNQATFVESFSSAEVTISATGLGGKTGWFVNDMEKNALLDARKSAVWFVLVGGTDPLLNSPDAKTKFEGIAEEFFKGENVNVYISWEADKVISTVKTKLPDGEKGVKMTKLFRVNKQKLTDDLAAKNVIVSKDALASAQGNPVIMVIPETPKGQTPMQVFDTNPLARHAAAVIESYLTARTYEVAVPRAAEQLADQSKMQAEVKGAEEDIAYQIALALGSDVYIIFAGTVTNGKASVQVKAYETTTARLLGTETGYSKTRAGAAMEPLVEEAINDAIDKVLARVSAYWTKDLNDGIQYKLIFNITSGFDDIQTVQDAISDCIDEGFAKNKENVATDKTMDYNVWAKKDDFKKARNVMRFIQKKMTGTAKVTQIVLNRKLIICGVQPE
ncbi:MAG: hypothetical protein A2350_04685 [Candidatus Raymondbacteria bacterium RifOxyB12_full_50_8]|uniref:Flagellar assembly protein T N-terminal domain-containing protein n=1 Tax=Candidatus Raymondbacteria bacterium RIFOXYD12_FULL_49_13 TaxID=1817890 RepID=A0A1F7F6P9_UNCRA|nr:MAG: hypothetical protein A2248_13245 [Candidatus Raymondbacteria bacterium RIFOXYA2_FULL_49_16]OGJ96063.1 MAG: hypothetical protein A2350_04685 [Candidatus Raymondbacteria bacterium RifOxyB12_full_50_8]OGK02252.1 MAG: hypothetical protein A2519_16360 [Candidatus Raymondbacteria bacterium RIFOXYD12_FULL_49_13]OGP45135.1 MAG: hypothetical protein A2324_12110 [Candidatus Raymondbacteria bacterium RIFOXYB2_FULL_49_35]